MKNDLLDRARQLSVDERIELAGAIWDTIPEHADRHQLEVPETHREELDRRLEAERISNEPGSPWAEARARLERRR